MGIKERQEREKEMRRRLIQNAAKDLFMQKGFKFTSIEDIAQKAELGISTIYHYFSGKDELYASLNLMTLELLVAEVEKVSADDRLSIDEKMMGIGRAFYRTYQHDPLALRIIFHVQLEDILLSLSDELLTQLNELGQKALALAGKVFQEGVRQGRFIEGEGVVHADIMWGMFTGIVIWLEAKKKLNLQKNFVEPTLERAFEIFLRGIQKNRP